MAERQVMAVSKMSVVTQDCEHIKEGLNELLGQSVTLIVKDRTKTKIKKGTITLVSDKLFCVDVIMGKYATLKETYTFLDVKTNKVRIKEKPDLNDEEAVIV